MDFAICYVFDISLLDVMILGLNIIKDIYQFLIVNLCLFTYSTKGSRPTNVMLDVNQQSKASI